MGWFTRKVEADPRLVVALHVQHEDLRALVGALSHAIASIQAAALDVSSAARAVANPRPPVRVIPGPPSPGYFRCIVNGDEVNDGERHVYYPNEWEAKAALVAVMQTRPNDVGAVQAYTAANIWEHFSTFGWHGWQDR